MNKSIISYYKPYKLLFILDLLFAVLGAAVALIIPLLLRYITGHISSMTENEGIILILKVGGIMIAMVVIEAISKFYMTYYGHMMGAYMEQDMRNEIFEQYQKLSFSFYDDEKVGHLMSRVTNDLFDISELLHHGPEDVFISVMKFVGSFVILVRIHVGLTIVAYCFLPFMMVYALYFNRKMKRAFKENRAKIADINSRLEDSLSGIRVVKSFANEEIELEKFYKDNERFVETKRCSYRYMGGYHTGLGALTTLVTVGVLIAGAVFMVQGHLQVADLVTFLLYITNLTDPVKKLVTVTEQFQNGYSGYERFREIIGLIPDIQDKEGAVEITHAKGDIRFEHVSFHYNTGKEDVLSSVDLHVKEGEYIAFVGSSGAGKTTLCSLIPRFYDVTEGRILLDGKDIRDITLKSLRNQIGIVQQDVYLFAGTVMENIRYGKPDATDEEVIQAAKNANAHEFIENLCDGYKTDIGQRGIKLSGGQKQRLAIARVFLKNPPILIFDEATSALDNESERIVQESMEKLAKNRTTFVIAHRLSTIRNAQRIVVLTENGIAEEGTHQQLMERNGTYAGLYNGTVG